MRLDFGDFGDWNIEEMFIPCLNVVGIVFLIGLTLTVATFFVVLFWKAALLILGLL